MQIKSFDYQKQLSDIRKDIQGAIGQVLDSGKLVLGEQVVTFENNFSKFIGCKYGIGVNSGTDALKISLKALGVSLNDEVITVSNTAVPTVSAIRELGARPVFVDVKEDFTMDEKLIVSAITKRTKIILPVHLYGKACNMTEINRVAKKYNLRVVEDCAQAHGCIFKNKKVGSYGVMSCFSFYPTKNLGAYGDGGMILTSNKNLADKCRRLRMYGMEKTYYAKEEGFNSRLDEIQAAILNVKLKYLNGWNKKKQNIARRYLNEIVNKSIKLPVVGDIEKHCFHQFVIRVVERDKLIEYFKNCDIGFGIHYPYPIHSQKAYRFLGCESSSLLKTVKYSKEILSLPIFPELNKNEVDYVIRCLNEYK